MSEGDAASRDSDLFASMTSFASSKKLSRRFSLVKLFRSKSSRTSLSVDSYPSRASAENFTENRDQKLSRRKSLAESFNKLVRKVSKKAKGKLPFTPAEDDKALQRHGPVSSMYMQGGLESQTFMGPRALSYRKSCIELRSSSSVSFFEDANSSTPTAGSHHDLRPRSRSHMQTSNNRTFLQPAEKSLQVVVTSDCVLQDQQKLYQGTLSITSQCATFQSTVIPSRIQFKIEYPKIVAILPQKYQGAGAIHIVTQTRLIKLVNIPQRDDTLRALGSEWINHCRRMLLPKTHTEQTLSHARRSAQLHSLNDQKRFSSGSTGSVLLDDIGTDTDTQADAEHYQAPIVEETLAGMPMGIVGVLFGGVADANVSFVAKFLTSRGSTLVEGEWQEDLQGFRARTLLLTVPNTLETTQIVHIKMQERITRQSADKFVLISRMQVHQRSSANSQQYHFRWTITRTNDTLSTVALHASVRAQVPPREIAPVNTGEDDVPKFIKELFVDMIKTLKAQLTAVVAGSEGGSAGAKSGAPIKAGWRVYLSIAVAGFWFCCMSFTMSMTPRQHRSLTAWHMGLLLVCLPLLVWLLVQTWSQSRMIKYYYLQLHYQLESTLNMSQENLSSVLGILARIKDHLVNIEIPI